MENYPNVHTIVTSIADGKTDIQWRWRRHAISYIKPALDYYSKHLKADLSWGSATVFARRFSRGICYDAIQVQ